MGWIRNSKKALTNSVTAKMGRAKGLPPEQANASFGAIPKYENQISLRYQTTYGSWPLPGSRVALSRAGGHGHTLVISLVLLLLAANLLAGGLWLLRRRNERDTLAAATGRRRPYQDPGHELRFGSEQNEAPERPAEAEAQAAAERRDSS